MTLTKETIHQIIDNRPGAVERALVAIWKRQTRGEQASRSTQLQNGEGFTSADASTLSRRAELVVEGYTLSPAELEDCKERLKKYWAQLIEVAIERELDRLAA